MQNSGGVRPLLERTRRGKRAQRLKVKTVTSHKSQVTSPKMNSRRQAHAHGTIRGGNYINVKYRNPRHHTGKEKEYEIFTVGMRQLEDLSWMNFEFYQYLVSLALYVCHKQM